MTVGIFHFEDANGIVLTVGVELAPVFTQRFLGGRCHIEKNSLLVFRAVTQQGSQFVIGYLYCILQTVYQQLVRCNIQCIGNINECCQTHAFVAALYVADIGRRKTNQLR